MQNIRQRILHIIQERGRATVAELADVLGMAPVSVRHHLDILQGDGLIQVDGVRRRRGAGRPQHIYSLTPEASQVFPKNYEEFLHLLLCDLEERVPDQEVEALLRRLAERMARKAAIPPGASLTDTLLEEVVSFLDERGYMARWERQENQIAITVANCPYAGLIQKHGKLCYLDIYLLQLLLQSEEEVELQTSIRDGAHRCRLTLPVYALLPAS